MPLDMETLPPDALVEWACQHAVGLRLPADRPWWFAGQLLPTTTEHQVKCACGHAPLKLRPTPCEDGSILFIGQHHGGCEAICWAWRPAG
ncbi:MAG: hypothetical protein KGL39_33780 [Patescibacteria group bacterium]|nr:hypothetical protein [Patescibacteria group bacterium]